MEGTDTEGVCHVEHLIKGYSPSLVRLQSAHVPLLNAESIG
ncbi:MAG TPA: hypothetical protein VFZ75_02050 [Actinomycetota bacterium]|nr:hypothetical protein [Actinomycetota bacterium]